MPATNSFDVTTGVDLQEVDNAVNQAQKEIGQRYDFKGSKAGIEFNRPGNMLVLVADDDFRMRALFDVLQQKLIKRGVSVKNLTVGEIKQAGGDTVRRAIFKPICRHFWRTSRCARNWSGVTVGTPPLPCKGFAGSPGLWCGSTAIFRWQRG